MPVLVLSGEIVSLEIRSELVFVEGEDDDIGEWKMGKRCPNHLRRHLRRTEAERASGIGKSMVGRGDDRKTR